MKKINLFRIKNPYFFISLFSLIFCLGVSWFFESNFAEIMFFMDYNAPDLTELTKSEYQNIFLESIMHWEIYIDSAFRYIIYFFPLFAIIPTIPFLRERRSYFVFGASRFRSYNKNLIRSLLVYTLEGGFCICLAFVIYFSIGSFFMTPALVDISGFASIFPEGFYSKYPYLFFIFMSTTIYFLIGCVFAGLSCSIALFTDKEFYVMLIPILIYILQYYTYSIFKIHLFHIPASVIAYNSPYTTLENFIPLIPFVILNVLLVLIFLRRRKNNIVF